MEVKIFDNYPSNIKAWDDLCFASGNLVQSTHFDKVQAFYKQKPIYFEVWNDSMLLAGVKMFFWQSEKNFLTRIISKRLSQFGEVICIDSVKIDDIVDLIREKVDCYLKKNRIVTYTVNGYYGGENLLIDLSLEAKKINYFKIAYINLLEKEDVLWSKVHSKHRNVIRKAIKNGVNILQDNNFNSFYFCLEKTYNNQELNPPNKDYLFNNYKHSSHLISIYQAYYEAQLLSSAWVSIYGTTAYYEFGGSVQNSLGAGNYLQWEIIKLLKKKNIHKYYLGQIAEDVSEKNIKFSLGITKFKVRFGVNEQSSFKKEYVLNITKNYFWIFLHNVFYALSKLRFK